MPFTMQHKQRTRERIITSARRLFNQRGFFDVSIDDVMADAGLTRGGFYNHFDNKEDLLLAAVQAYQQCNPTDAWEGVELDYNVKADLLAQQMLSAYLSTEHLNDVASHCPLVALPADISRAGSAVRGVYDQLLNRMIDVFADADGVARDTAYALTAMCVGAMLIGRTSNDKQFSERIIKASREVGSGLLSDATASSRRRRRAPKSNQVHSQRV